MDGLNLKDFVCTFAPMIVEVYSYPQQLNFEGINANLDNESSYSYSF